TATTTLTPTTGQIGVGRINRYAGTAKLDDFTITAAGTGVKESFDTTATGATPAGWQTWVGGAPGGFGAAGGTALSTPNGFARTGGSGTVGRAWATAALPADVDASAAVYLNGLIPAQVFARG